MEKEKITYCELPNVNKWISCTLLVECRQYLHFGKQFGMIFKGKHVSILQTISVPDVYHEFLQDYIPGHMHKNIYKVVHNTEILETNQNICHTENGKYKVV